MECILTHGAQADGGGPGPLVARVAHTRQPTRVGPRGCDSGATCQIHNPAPPTCIHVGGATRRSRTLKAIRFLRRRRMAASPGFGWRICR